MVASITAATKMRVYIDFDAMAVGGGTVMVGGLYANDPGQGQGLVPSAAGNAQTLRLQVGETVLGYSGNVTLAEIQTALVAIANDIAGATGTPQITTAVLAQINGWATGSP